MLKCIAFSRIVCSIFRSSLFLIENSIYSWWVSLLVMRVYWNLLYFDFRFGRCCFFEGVFELSLLKMELQFFRDRKGHSSLLLHGINKQHLDLHYHNFEDQTNTFITKEHRRLLTNNLQQRAWTFLHQEMYFLNFSMHYSKLKQLIEHYTTGTAGKDEEIDQYFDILGSQ